MYGSYLGLNNLKYVYDIYATIKNMIMNISWYWRMIIDILGVIM